MPLRPLTLAWAFGLAAAGAAQAQDDLSFDPAATVACLAAGADVGVCAGLSASLCMDSPSGYTTVGMGWCLGAELDYWDGRLNAAYQTARDQLQKNDDEYWVEGTPKQADSLRDMQRAWITFRDARCTFERSFWSNGTGGGPAQLQCLMTETAQQAVYIEANSTWE